MKRRNTLFPENQIQYVRHHFLSSYELNYDNYDWEEEEKKAQISTGPNCLRK